MYSYNTGTAIEKKNELISLKSTLSKANNTISEAENQEMKFFQCLFSLKHICCNFLGKEMAIFCARGQISRVFFFKVNFFQ